mmetsp:Transcript_3161/g.4898  ORF Transcript_3161/g.4898 Transcript_3161/m.4898 type:complete len:234 (+) Transcript_3161:116-817(+)|eukprot:CAMPEP_0185031592 /NCGR_PEP_ID=MMETSP1103-20130426/19147_1 /TAXON_ID=36769 /ORGANISM="Paraphysomonas bandaiensis, Strain Caron Lab Isolate" /LENGTH=233 /DNA_ID=CAMNT_0027567157 /DNA_START=40 /DNA_END=741 /DNA_ORIENTATION=+
MLRRVLVSAPVVVSQPSAGKLAFSAKSLQKATAFAVQRRFLCTNQKESAEAEVKEAEEVDKEVPSDAASDENVEQSLEELNKALEAQVRDMKNKVLRAYADEENVRRIAKRDVENARVYANTKFAKSLLDVADNLERALQAASAEKQGENKPFDMLVEGVTMTHNQLKKVFESHGVVKYGEVGEQFDPTLHDALFQIPDPEKPEGTIGQVLKAGYKLNDRVIRAAEVGTIKQP